MPLRPSPPKCLLLPAAQASAARCRRRSCEAAAASAHSLAPEPTRAAVHVLSCACTYAAALLPHTPSGPKGLARSAAPRRTSPRVRQRMAAAHRRRCPRRCGRAGGRGTAAGRSQPAGSTRGKHSQGQRRVHAARARDGRCYRLRRVPLSLCRAALACVRVHTRTREPHAIIRAESGRSPAHAQPNVGPVRHGAGRAGSRS